MHTKSEILDQAPPHDLDAERSVLGSVLIDPAVLDSVTALLRPADLYDPRHRCLYGHILHLPDVDTIRDPTLLLGWLREAGDLEACGGMAYIGELYHAVAVASHAPYYAASVAQYAQRRRLREAAERLLVRSHDLHEDPATIAAEATQGLSEPFLSRGPRIISAAKLAQKHHSLRPPVIHGLAREGETVNVIAASKAGKSWLMYALAYAVSLGRDWMGFDCEPGRVLLLDNELHEETINYRLTATREAMDLPLEARDRIDVVSLRGHLVDLHQLGKLLGTLKPGTHKLVIADAFYRFLPVGLNENSNADITALYNCIDEYSSRLHAAWVNVHHSSKGDQSQKTVTDVGSGAGAQSRAADTHLVLRPHEEDGKVVLEAVTRSFPPVEPTVLRWEFPRWTPDADADPARLRQAKTQRQISQEQADDSDKQRICNFLAEHGRCSTKKLRNHFGISRDRIARLLSQLTQDRHIIEYEITFQNRPANEYELPPDADPCFSAFQ